MPIEIFTPNLCCRFHKTGREIAENGGKDRIMKSLDLTGVALDWAVAVCQGGTEFLFDGITIGFKLKGQQKVLSKGWASCMSYCPSTDWAQGGPIIEREHISLDLMETQDAHAFLVAQAPAGDGEVTEFHASGPTPLIAAMRCYVASKLRDDYLAKFLKLDRLD